MAFFKRGAKFGLSVETTILKFLKLKIEKIDRIIVFNQKKVKRI